MKHLSPISLLTLAFAALTAFVKNLGIGFAMALIVKGDWTLAEQLADVVLGTVILALTSPGRFIAGSSYTTSTWLLLANSLVWATTTLMLYRAIAHARGGRAARGMQNSLPVE